jgi:RNA polymerase sigma factor (sigma-70 family)
MWLQYRKSSDQGLRDRLILTYAPLVKYVAGRLGSGLPAHVDEGDLVSYGLLGLIGAIERYEPDRDVKFETYAIARIKARSSTSSARWTGCPARCGPAHGRSSARSLSSRRSPGAHRPTTRSRRR